MDNKVLIDAMNQSYNFEFNEALKKLNALTLTNQNDPRIYLYLSNIYAWQYLSDKEASDFQKFEFYSNKVIELSENLLTKNPNDYEARFTLASIYGYRSLVYLLTKKYVDGIWSAKKCLSLTDELIAVNKNYYDIYLWKGVFDFALSQIPGIFKSILKLAGIEGDFIKGVNELKLCAQKSELSEVEAKYFLSQIYSVYLNENDEAENYLIELTNRFNNNSLFLYSLASVKIKLKKIDEAHILLDRVIEISNSKFKSVKSLSYFLKGDCYFYNNQFNLAKPFYQKFIKEHNDVDYKSTALYRLGLCYEFTNQQDLAKDYFKKVTANNSTSEDDVYAKRKAEECLNKSWSAEELSLIFNINLFSSGKLNIAQRNFEEMLKLNKRTDLKTQILFQLGLIHLERKNFENAKTYFNNVINSNSKNELWLMPFSHYYLAKIFTMEGDKHKARINLDKIYSFQDYDFEKMLKIWVESLKFKNGSLN